MSDDELRLSSLTSDSGFDEDPGAIFTLARECMSQECGYWSLPPPEFLLPPPPKPPFMLEDCRVNPLASSVDPESGHPSPVLATSHESRAVQDLSSQYEVCDNLPIPTVIDSKVFVNDPTVNYLVIVSCAVILVAIILTVAGVIWRRFLVSRRSGLLVNKSSLNVDSDFEPHNSGRSPRQQQHNYFNSLSSEGQDSCHFVLPSVCNNWRKSMKKEKQTNLEMASSSQPESSGCHVYTNPNYPHSSHDVPESAKQIEIGGLPFYLPSGRVAETSLTTWKPPGSPRSTGSPLNTGFTYDGDFWKAKSPVPPGDPSQGKPEKTRPFFPLPPPPPLNQTKEQQPPAVYEEGNYSSSTGPIYEDIDRNCSYRGKPPQPSRSGCRPSPRDGKKLRGPDYFVDDPDDDPAYYNFEPSLSSQSNAHVIVNPMISIGDKKNTNLRSKPQSPGRSHQSPHVKKRLTSATTLSSTHSTPTKSSGGSSIYYYSDTLRHGAGRGDRSKGARTAGDGPSSRVDSDSGISISRDFNLDDTPTMRQQILMVNSCSPALTSLTSSPSSSPLSTSTASPSNRPTCTSPSRFTTSPNPRMAPNTRQRLPKYI